MENLSKKNYNFKMEQMIKILTGKIKFRVSRFIIDSFGHIIPRNENDIKKKRPLCEIIKLYKEVKSRIRKRRINNSLIK